MNLILASNSPRRKELLQAYGFEFEVVVSAFNEQDQGLTPSQAVMNNALGKAKDVYDKLLQKDVVVLGADTVVSFDNEILGKPKTKEQAIKMLKSLSGKVHSVYTGYCIISKDKVICDAVETKVEFNSLSDKLINEYVATGKSMDKAGAYGIQDGFELVKSFNGSFNNVVGLPIEIFSEQLKELLSK